MHIVVPILFPCPAAREKLLDKAYRKAWRCINLPLFAKPSSRRELPSLSPAGLRRYLKYLVIPLLPDLATSVANLPVEQAAEPTRVKKMRRKPTLK